jgi:hypothetical protein
MLSIQLQNGTVVKAPLEAWVMALVAELPPARREVLLEKVAKGHVMYKTPGQHILHAEGMDLIAPGGIHG